MQCIPRNALALALLVLIPTCTPFQIQQLPEFKDVIRDKVLHAVNVVQERYNIAESLGLSLPFIGPILQRRAATDLSHIPNFLQSQKQLTKSIKAIMPLVVNPLLLASGTCDASSAPWPLPPAQNTNSTYHDMLWEAKFTSKLGDHHSFQGTAGLDTAGQGVKGFGIEVQPDSLSPDYSIGMQWSFQHSIAGFTFAVSIASDELRSAGLADIHLLYSHPHWLCSSRCSATTFSQSLSDPSSARPMNAGNVVQFVESAALQGFGVTFQKFNDPEPDLAPLIDQFPKSISTLTSPALRSHLAEIQTKLRSQNWENGSSGFSFNVGDVTTVWTNATNYQWVNSSYCPGCGDVLQKPFDVDPADGLAAIETIMLIDSMKAQFTVGQPSNADLTTGLEGQASIGLSSGCDATHVLLDTPNASLGALVNSVKDSYGSGVTDRMLGAMGPAAQLAVQDASLDISVDPSAVEVTTIGLGLPWLPAGASQTNNLLVWLTSVAVSPKVNISMKAQFHTQLALEFGMQSLADPDESATLRLASQQGNGLEVSAYMQTSEEGSQISHDMLVTMPLEVCMANCSSPREQKQMVHFTGNAHPVQSGLVGTLYSDAPWPQAFGFPFMHISAIGMQLVWPMHIHRPTKAEWQGALCLGTVENCARGHQPSLTGHVSAGINTNGAEGNYLVGRLPQFKVGTLIDVVTKYGTHATMKVALAITDALVLPRDLLPPGGCGSVDEMGIDAWSGCSVLLTFPYFTDRNHLPDAIQLTGRLQLSNWLLNVTIDITNNAIVLRGPLPLWCLKIGEACVMNLGGVLNDRHAQGPSALQISLGQQGTLFQITGAADIPTLKGCGMVSFHLADDGTFQYTGPFTLFGARQPTVVNISWLPGSSFLVEMGSIVFSEGIPILTDVRFRVEENDPLPTDGSFSLQATWKFFNLVVPDVDIDFAQDKIRFSLQARGLEGLDPELAQTVFEIYGEGHLEPSGNPEDTKFQITMDWQIEQEVNALLQNAVIDLAGRVVHALNNVTAQMNRMFQEVQDIFETKLMYIRDSLALNLEKIADFLSSDFEAVLDSYDGTYDKEPSASLLSYPVDKGLTGEVNKYGCPEYIIIISKQECGSPQCKARLVGPYIRSDCMVPKISALNIVRGLRDAMALRQAEIETALRTEPSFLAIAKAAGLLESDEPSDPLSALIPHLSVGAKIQIDTNQSNSDRLVVVLTGFADDDSNPKKSTSATPTPTRVFVSPPPGTRPFENNATLANVSFNWNCSVNVTNGSSFGTCINNTVNNITESITEGWGGLKNLTNFSGPMIYEPTSMDLPCFYENPYDSPPFAVYDPACEQGAEVRVIEVLALPSPCGQTILSVKWQAFDSPTCGGKSNVQVQILTIYGPDPLSFETFPNDVTILNNMSADPSVLGSPTSPPPTCNLTSVISSHDVLRHLSGPGQWAIDRTWSIMPVTVDCYNPDDEEAYKLSLSYTQVQSITIQDATPPVFTSTPPNPLILNEGADPSPSLVGIPTAIDPVHPDLLGRRVIGSSVSITYTDVVTTLPDLKIDNHVGFVQYQRTWRATDESGNSATFVQMINVKIGSDVSGLECKDCAPVSQQCKDEEAEHLDYLHTDLAKCYHPDDILELLAEYGCRKSDTPDCNLIICDYYVPEKAWDGLETIQCDGQ